MADSLYLSIWFPSFREEEMMPRTATCCGSSLSPRCAKASLTCPSIPSPGPSPPCWSAVSIPASRPKKRSRSPSEFAHDDFAFVFEAFWDLWVPNDDAQGDSWVQRPIAVSSSSTVCNSTKASTPRTATSRSTSASTARLCMRGRISPSIEKGCAPTSPSWSLFRRSGEELRVSGRVLWSESEENLAQKLIAKLQQTQ